MLIDRGADIDLPDKTGWSPLNRASRNNSIDIAKVESIRTN